MKPNIFTICLILLLQSCFSLKSEYPSIKYYYLKKDPFSFRNIPKKDVILAFEDFDFPYEILSTNQLQVRTIDNIVKKYFYLC